MSASQAVRKAQPMRLRDSQTPSRCIFRGESVFLANHLPKRR
jgi:hypothetical protein